MRIKCDSSVLPMTGNRQLQDLNMVCMIPLRHAAAQSLEVPLSASVASAPCDSLHKNDLS